jgi:hypothetical protein
VRPVGVLSLFRFFRRRERFKEQVEEEAGVLLRRHGPRARAYVEAQLGRDDLTSRYRKVLKKVAARLRD